MPDQAQQAAGCWLSRRYHGACAGASQEEVDALGDADWECPECGSARCGLYLPLSWDLLDQLLLIYLGVPYDLTEVHLLCIMH